MRKRNSLPRAVKKLKKVPTIYDFGANWKNNIVPHLNDPEVQEALKSGILAYLGRWGHEDKYTVDKLPYQYSSCDGIEMLFSALEERVLIPKLLESRELTSEEQVLRDEMKDLKKEELELKELEENEDPRFDDAEDKHGDKFCQFYDKIRDLYYPFEVKQKELFAYVIYNGIHDYWEKFGLVLARKVLPEYKWDVVVEDGLCKILNKDRSINFCLMSWCYDDNCIINPIDSYYGLDNAIVEYNACGDISSESLLVEEEEEEEEE